MNPHDPKLSAYLLGELSSAEAEEVEQAAASQPAIRAALDELKPMIALLHGTLPAAPPAPTLTERQQQRVLSQARQPHKPAPSNVLRFLAPALAVAACAAIGVTMFLQLRPDEQGAIADTPEPPQPSSAANDPLRVKLLPRGATRDSTDLPSARNPDAMHFAIDTPRPGLGQFLPVPVSEANEVLLPMLASNSSLQWLATEVRDKKTLPAPADVRVAELVNAYPLRPTGNSTTSDGVTLAAESLACPWKPSSRLQLIRVQGADAGPRRVRTALKFNPDTVASYRVLGFTPVRNGNGTDAWPDQLDAKQATNVLVEVEPTAKSGTLGNVQLAVRNGKPVELALPDVSTAPSEDARFATLLAAYGLWLAKDPAQRALGSDFIAAMVREFDLEKLTDERRDTLRLIQQSLDLQK